MGSVGVLPVLQVLGDDEVFEVVVDGSLVVLQKCVGVAQAVTGLSFHRSVPQLPGQLEGPSRQKKINKKNYQVKTVQTTVHLLLYCCYT